MKKYLLLLLIIIVKISFSQNEGNIWYFGYQAGIDFNEDPPVALTNSVMSQREGCASISDHNGHILFYTDGQTVYNRNHTIMANGTGLNGGQSSTQSGIIVPYPGHPTLYYIFTVPEDVGYDGIRYSIVDLTLDNGLGAITDVKNEFLVSPSMEKITGVRHANGTDVWIITHLWNSNSFHAYLINSNGINENPVISNVGIHHSGLLGDTHGQLKVSSDGHKLGITTRVNQSFQLFDFDNSTGVVSNPITFPSIYHLVYGIEFSPDCSRMYVSKYEDGSNIYQFDLTAPNPQEIIESKILIGTVSNSHVGALQLAPDQKIYVAKTNSTSGDQYLGVINDPNEPGLSCNFVEDGFYLNGRACVYGLPNFLQNYFLANFTFNPVCFGDETHFEITNTTNIVSVLWDFGDPTSGSNNTSTLLNPYHVFSSAGTFTVTLTIEYPDNTHVASQEVTIHPYPQPHLGNDTVVCGSEALVLNPGNNFSSYFWQDGSEDSNFLVTESGLYWVQVTNEFGCMATDSVNIGFAPELTISIGNDSTLCEGDTLMLCAGSGYVEYLWPDGSEDSCYTATNSGTYWVRVTDEYQCVAFDTVHLVFLPSAAVSFGPDTLICYNETLLLDPGEGYENYLWQDGSQGQSFLVSEPGTYWVQVSNQCGAGGDTINVDFTEPYDISLGNDTSFCYGHSIILNPGAGYTSYLWDDGSELQFNTVSTGGFHWVEVTDSLGCTAMDSIYIDVFNSFEISIGEDSLHICEGGYVFLNGPDGFETYQWQDGSDSPSILADTAGIYWLEVTDENGCAARDSVYLFVNIIPDTLLGNDTVICQDETIQLAAKPGYAGYIWQDGSSGPTFTADHAGLYWVTVQDEIGCMGTDSIVVSDFEIPGLGLAEQEWLCHDDTLTLDAGGGHLSYLWNDGSQEQTLDVTNEGIYSVDIGTICGTYTDMVDVKLYEGDMNLGNDTTLCSNEYLVLTPGGGYSNFLWSTGSTDSTILVSRAGDYWLTAFDGFCMVSDTIVIDACATLIVPNVFTPNSDGKNDTFYAKATNDEGIFNFKMVIFNRWGRVVHTLNDITEHWNGKINNSDAAEGVYFWVCDYSARDKYGNINAHSQQGDVTLIR